MFLTDLEREVAEELAKQLPPEFTVRYELVDGTYEIKLAVFEDDKAKVYIDCQSDISDTY
jgi:hypothetical protein